MATDISVIEAAADKLRLLVAICGAAQEGAPLRRAAELVAKLHQEAGRAHKNLTAPILPEHMGMARAFGERSLKDLSRKLADLRDKIAKFDVADISIPERDFFIEELRQVSREFGNLTITADRVSVRTEPITLEHQGISVALGPFDLVLEYPRGALAARGGNRVFDLRIRAVEPNPAHDHDDITHPHVRGNSLCEGEAAAAIRYALDEGRLADVFAIVDATLHTYNPGSPYVKIERWTAIVCPLCGQRTLDTAVCSDCGAQVCTSCIATCGVCGQQACKNCIGTCACCGDVKACDNCSSTCSAGCEHKDHLCVGCKTKCSVCSVDLCCHCLRLCHICGVPLCEAHRVQHGDLFACAACGEEVKKKEEEEQKDD